MWTVALTLNRSLSEQPRFRPDNAKFADPYVAFRYIALLAATEFEGLSVSIAIELLKATRILKYVRFF